MGKLSYDELNRQRVPQFKDGMEAENSEFAPILQDVPFNESIEHPVFKNYGNYGDRTSVEKSQ